MTKEAGAMRSSTKYFVAGLLSASFVLAGCGSSGDSSDDHASTGSDDHTAINPANPAELDADATATTAMQAILSWQPAVDTSKSDALVRARPWLGGDLLATVDSSGSTESGVRPDSEWLAWKASGDALTASCARADSTPAAPTGMRTVVIDVSCRQTVLHATGSSTKRSAETWRTTVTRTDDGWRLTDFRYQ